MEKGSKRLNECGRGRITKMSRKEAAKLSFGRRATKKKVLSWLTFGREPGR
jgi:hypothetical protein